ncbi:unnamed protein product [marine sediment metagenome]|uniref:Uncharacterized protein n=1 Tax=marine sediment metagenome TaxID=412755 RepID=X1NZN1_9ZZZZ
MDKEKRIVKKGTNEWWTTIAMLRIARRQRKLEEITESNPVTLSTEDINAEISYLNRHLSTRIWILLTNGDMTEKIVESALGNEVRIKQ